MRSIMAAVNLSRVANLATRFRQDRNGSVAMMFAITFLVVFGMVSLSIDYGRGLNSKAKLQQAMDAALLAGATASSTADRAAIATTYLASAFYDASATITSSSFNYDSTSGTLTGTAIARMPNLFSGWWKTSFDLSAAGSAGVGTAAVRALDVVMCIDSTGSMSNTLSAVQSNALNFKTNLDAALVANGSPSFDQYRVRAIYYKDYGGNGYMNLTQNWYGRPYYPYGGPVSGTSLGDSTPLSASSFFTLPSGNSNFSSFVTGVWASGGGDLPESGLECLNEAMDSAWTDKGTVLSNGKTITEVYPVIAIYTDAGAHPPNFTWSVQNPNYPSSSKMPRDYAGLLAKWNDASEIDQTHKMILFYGNPSNEDDSFFGNTSGWETIKTWPGFSNPGSLTSANTSFISTLASGISTQYNNTRLTN